MASTTTKQTYRQTTIYLLCLACLATSASMFINQVCLTTHKINPNNISVRSKLLQNQSVTVSQKPECFNKFLTKLETYTGSLLPLSEKIGEMFCFAFQHYILSNNQSQHSKIVMFLHQWQ